ncbi:hypothetical protein ES703_07987 [subsurface metagenome]
MTGAFIMTPSLVILKPMPGKEIIRALDFIYTPLFFHLEQTVGKPVEVKELT